MAQSCGPIVPLSAPSAHSVPPSHSTQVLLPRAARPAYLCVGHICLLAAHYANRPRHLRVGWRVHLGCSVVSHGRMVPRQGARTRLGHNALRLTARLRCAPLYCSCAAAPPSHILPAAALSTFVVVAGSLPALPRSCQQLALTRNRPRRLASRRCLVWRAALPLKLLLLACPWRCRPTCDQAAAH